jgi:hypothetical protein
MTPVPFIKPKLAAHHRHVGSGPVADSALHACGSAGAPEGQFSVQTRPFARRTFLGAALVLGAAAIARSLIPYSISITGEDRKIGKLIKSLQDVTYETLLELTGVPLMARSPGAEKSHFTLKLASVTRASAPARRFPPVAGRDFESLSLIFDGPADQPALQNTYELEVPGRGRFLLFIVPMQPAAGPRRYQAIINRPLSIKTA